MASVPAPTEATAPVLIGVCRVCGCTDRRACPGGCSWVNAIHNLCSACAPAGNLGRGAV